MHKLSLVLAFLAILQKAISFSSIPLRSIRPVRRTNAIQAAESSDSVDIPAVEQSDNYALDSALAFLKESSRNVPSYEERRTWDYTYASIMEDSIDWPIPYERIAEIKEREAQRIANQPPPAMLANRAAMEAAILKWRRDEHDSGSPEVQVAILTERIRYLTAHLLKHPQDNSTKRGLQALVNNRRNNLNFLHTVDSEKARLMCAELGIRWKPPGQLWDKEAKYSAFKNTKNKKAEAKKLAKKKAKQELLDKQMAKKMRKMQVQY